MCPLPDMSSPERIPEMKHASLCKICRTIPFDGLILPYQHEAQPLSEQDHAQVSGFFNMSNDRADTKIRFGLMSRVLRNEDACGFCEMVGNILRNHHTSPYGPRDKIIFDEIGRPYYESLPEKADRPCEIKLMWFVGIKHPTNPSKGRWSGRLFVNWKDDRGAYHGAYSCFQTLQQHKGLPSSKLLQADPFSHELFCGGRARPLNIDIEWIRHWIDLCAHGHTAECKTPIKAPIRNGAKIRLINVKKMCLDVDIDLMDPDHDYRYLALSYVWGEDTSKHRSTLTGNILESLQQPGSLVKDDLPTTLADFVTLAQLLDVTHVWVDAVCIIQDDREDKMIQIGMMNAIYQRAFITIIAAAGNNADAGLPGLRSGTRAKTPKEITIRLSDLDKRRNGDCDYITLIETLNHPEHTQWSPITSSAWNSRAWTYQEKLLSRRILVFTQEQLYWSCNEASFCEEVCMEVPQHNIMYHSGFVDPIESSFHTIFRDSVLDPQDSLAKTQSQVWKAYRTFVMHYSRRHMKYHGDYHAAFAGILEAMSLQSNDDFLLGHPRSRFDQGLAWTNFRSIARRTARSALPMTASGVRTIVPSWSWMGWVGEVSFNVTQEKEADGALPQVECFTHHTSPVRLVPARASGDQKEADWVYLSTTGPTLDDVEHFHPSLTNQILQDIPDETILFFWASTSSFRVEYPAMSDYDMKALGSVDQAPKPKILNEYGEVVGELQQLERPPFQDGDKAEFVVIERKSEPDPQMAIILGEEVRLTVLQIGWRLDAAGSGSCKERLNIGHIDEKDWLKSRPEKKLIALQ